MLRYMVKTRIKTTSNVWWFILSVYGEFGEWLNSYCCFNMFWQHGAMWNGMTHWDVPHKNSSPWGLQQIDIRRNHPQGLLPETGSTIFQWASAPVSMVETLLEYIGSVHKLRGAYERYGRYLWYPSDGLHDDFLSLLLSLFRLMSIPIIPFLWEA